MLKRYLCKPEEVEGIGLVYPVRILDWEDFSKLASKYLLYGYDFLKYRVKAKDDVRLFDFLIAMVSSNILESDESDGYMALKEVEDMLSAVLRHKVHGMLNAKTHEWWFETSAGGRITRDNYDQLRDIVLKQNLLFEPIVAPDEFSQKVIDDAIATIGKQGNPVSMESMLATVGMMKCIGAEELEKYTYYQLRADYEIAQRIEYNRAIHMYRAQGSEAQPIPLTDELSIHTNPYGRERLFRKVDKGSDRKLQKMMS